MSINEAEFTPAGLALSRVAKRLGSANKAKKAFVDDLAAGHIHAAGVAHQAGMGLMLARDPSLDGVVLMPPTFWSRTDDDDRRNFDWDAGEFTRGESGGLRDGAPSIWKAVRFETVRLDDVGKKKTNRGRDRRAGWEDWVAALAVVVRQGKVTAKTGDTELFKMVAEQMGEWEIHEPPRGTVYPTIIQVLRRLHE